MCHGQPYIHRCGHMSVVWSMCMHSRHIPGTSTSSPCGREKETTLAGNLRIDTPCPVPECRGPELGTWRCCKCGFEPNERGWCSGDITIDGQPQMVWNSTADGDVGAWTPVNTCDHGNCSNCTTLTRRSPTPPPEPPPPLDKLLDLPRSARAHRHRLPARSRHGKEEKDKKGESSNSSKSSQKSRDAGKKGGDKHGKGYGRESGGS
ncbi:hypothetical protein VTK73DRAFT_8562 [Phialemonium thermophilum]|uniref:Uncharacterized protein n=1 Tax=Phialemonium thermophilum TaxID=223376 RepID=A0ABR3XPN2_9PEZI